MSFSVLFAPHTVPIGTPYVVLMGQGDGHIIDERGDDIWLLDPDGLIVDYVGWRQTIHLFSQKGAGPLAALGIWDSSWENDIWTATGNQSMSLATSTNADSSGCWEPTASGDVLAGGAGRCAAPDRFLTVSTAAGELNSVGSYNYQ